MCGDDHSDEDLVGIHQQHHADTVAHADTDIELLLILILILLLILIVWLMSRLRLKPDQSCDPDADVI